MAPLVSLLLDHRDVADTSWRWRVEACLATWPHEMPPIPPAGTWVRSSGPWHLSSGQGDQPLPGRAHGWYRIRPACGWQWALVADTDMEVATSATPRRIATRRTRPDSDVCPRCLARSERTVAA